MATGPVNKVMDHLRRATLRADAAGLSDGRLLECFVARRDEAAFEALVRRHGAMVLGVCRRVLRHHHDAEDAFQATFLVLARKAGSVRAATVANWLYGVAYHVALKARALAGRKRTRERQVIDMPEPAAHPQSRWQELEPLLDQELSRLPDRYRIPVVLCDLEGKTLKAAAQQLGWRPGTLAGRLFRARQLLAKRLARHGPLFSGGLLATTLTENAAAAVPAPLVVSTVKAASLFAAGPTASAGVVSAKAVSLTKGTLKTMLLKKLKITSIVTLAAVGFALIAGTGFYPAPAAPPGQAQLAPAVPPVVVDPATGAAPPAPVVEEPQVDNSKSDKLPIGLPPQQALVRLEKDGQVAVTTSAPVYQPVTSVTPDGQPITTYQLTSKTMTQHYKLAEIKVQNAKGKAIDSKELLKLKGEVLVLVNQYGQPVDPLHLRLIKEDTMILLIGTGGPPASPLPPIAPSGAPPVPGLPAGPPAIAPPIEPGTPDSGGATPPA